VYVELGTGGKSNSVSVVLGGKDFRLEMNRSAMRRLKGMDLRYEFVETNAPASEAGAVLGPFAANRANH
jgi:hypothetical protein